MKKLLKTAALCAALFSLSVRAQFYPVGKGEIPFGNTNRYITSDPANLLYSGTNLQILLSGTNNSGVFPAYSFTGPNNNTTGMYLAGTNKLGFSTNGINRLLIDGAGTITVSSSSTLVFPAAQWVLKAGDSMSGALNLGTSANGTFNALTVTNNNTTSSQAAGQLLFYGYNGSSVALGSAFGLTGNSFTGFGDFQPNQTFVEGAGNGGVNISSTNATGSMSFYTGGNTAANKRMFIDASGNINVPGMSASSLVQTDGSKNFISSNALPSGTTGPFVLKSGDTMTGRLTSTRFLSNSSSASLPSLDVGAGDGIFNGGTHIVAWAINGAEKMRLNASGRLLLGTTTDDTVNVLQVLGGATVTNTLTAATVKVTGLTPLSNVVTDGTGNLISSNLSMGGVSVFTSAGAGTFVTPSNSSASTIYLVTLLGGGGGGGAVSSGTGNAGGGGAGGFAVTTLTGATAGQSLTLNVGSAGGSSSGSGTGGTGGPSWISTIVGVTAGGGTGGTGNAGTGAVSGGGGGAVTGAAAKYSFTGASGGTGPTSSLAMGGYGAIAGGGLGFPGSQGVVGSGNAGSGTGYGAGGAGGSQGGTGAAGLGGIIIIRQLTP